MLESVNSLGFWDKKLSQALLIWKIIHEISIRSYLLFLRQWNNQTQVRLQHQRLLKHREAQAFPENPSQGLKSRITCSRGIAKLISDKCETWALIPSPWIRTKWCQHFCSHSLLFICFPFNNTAFYYKPLHQKIHHKCRNWLCAGREKKKKIKGGDTSKDL